jgi:hypothetical protein
MSHVYVVKSRAHGIHAVFDAASWEAACDERDTINMEAEDVNGEPLTVDSPYLAAIYVVLLNVREDEDEWTRAGR